MNAITVNYAEVGDDHIPVSFGFGSKTSFENETVYNSTITEISGTSCIILQDCIKSGSVVKINGQYINKAEANELDLKY